MLTNTKWDGFINAVCTARGEGPEMARPFSAFWGETHNYDLGNPDSRFRLAALKAAEAFPEIITGYLEKYPLTIPVKSVAKIPINLVVYEDEEEIYVHTVTLLVNENSKYTGDYGVIDPQHLGSDDDGRFPYYLTPLFKEYILDGTANEDIEVYAINKTPLRNLLINFGNPPKSDTSFQVYVEMPKTPPPSGVALADQIINPAIVDDITLASEDVWKCLNEGVSEGECETACYETASQHLYKTSSPDFGGTVKRNRKQRKTKRKRQIKNRLKI